MLMQNGPRERKGRLKVEQTAGIVHRARNPEKAEHEVIQSTCARIGLAYLTVVTHAEWMLSRQSKLPTKTVRHSLRYDMLARLTPVLPVGCGCYPHYSYMLST